MVEAEVENTHRASSIGWAYFRLPPFSPVALRIMQSLNEEDDRAEELSKLISSDQAFASAVLTLANSALYAHYSPVTDILRAIHRLGQRKLQGLCMGVAMMTLVSRQARDGVVRDLWAHNLACGLIAETMAVGTDMIDGNAFTCGLLHDVGRLAMYVLQPERYGHILQAHRGSPASILQRETDLFGFDHCAAGCEVVRSWNFPAPFNEIIKAHHAPITSTSEWSLVNLISTSCKIADAAGFPAFPGCEATPYPELIDELPQRIVNRLDPDVESLSSEISGSIELLRVA